jgi:hypothetical protein
VYQIHGVKPEEVDTVLGLSIMEKHNGVPAPLSAEELAELQRRALQVEHTVFAPVA